MATPGVSCFFATRSAAQEARLGNSWRQLLSKKLSKRDPLPETNLRRTRRVAWPRRLEWSSWPTAPSRLA